MLSTTMNTLNKIFNNSIYLTDLNTIINKISCWSISINQNLQMYFYKNDIEQDI